MIGNDNLKALDLSRQYWNSVAEPALKRAFPKLYPKIAAGLVGNGSDCFGYDDVISRDHDWGVDFYLWVLEEDRDSIPELSEWKEALLKKHPPIHLSAVSRYGLPRTIMTVDDFYKQLLGRSSRPETTREWIAIPEENLAIATNGAVFLDSPRLFTGIREDFLRFYPDDLRRKRLAAFCMEAAQTGQYNLKRMAARGEWVATRQTLARFVEAAMSIVFLLNNRYRPYYKWMHRMLSELPVLGTVVSYQLTDLACMAGLDERSIDAQADIVERVCALIVNELRRQGLSQSESDFLANHGESVQAGITDDFLGRLPAQCKI